MCLCGLRNRKRCCSSYSTLAILDCAWQYRFERELSIRPLNIKPKDRMLVVISKKIWLCKLVVELFYKLER